MKPGSKPKLIGYWNTIYESNIFLGQLCTNTQNNLKLITIELYNMITSIEWQQKA